MVRGSEKIKILIGEGGGGTFIWHPIVDALEGGSRGGERMTFLFVYAESISRGGDRSLEEGDP